MDASTIAPAPFVNAELMQRYMNNNVRIVGKLHEENAMEITMVSSDGKHVKVRTYIEQRRRKLIAKKRDEMCSAL